jgi:hypothetical protein
MRTVMRRVAVIAVVIVIGTSTVACQGRDGDGDGSAATTTTTTTTTAAERGSPNDDASTIAMKDFGFEPSRIELSTGVAALNLENVGTATHTFTIDDPNVNHEVAPGQGMQGTIVVAGS